MKIKTKYNINDYVCYTSDNVEIINKIKSINININDTTTDIVYSLYNGVTIKEIDINYKLVKCKRYEFK